MLRGDAIFFTSPDNNLLSHSRAESWVCTVNTATLIITNALFISGVINHLFSAVHATKTKKDKVVLLILNPNYFNRYTYTIIQYKKTLKSRFFY